MFEMADRYLRIIIFLSGMIMLCTAGSTVLDDLFCNSDTDCTNHIANTVCTNHTCSCAPGYCIGSATYYCQKVQLNMVCTYGVAGDAFCQSGVSDSYCDPRYGLCRCRDGYSNVVEGGISKCVEFVKGPACTVCVSTGGVCQDLDADGTPDECGCPQYQVPSNPKDSLSAGCDVHEVPTGGCCSVPGRDVICSDPAAECKYADDLSSNFFCQCVIGFVPVFRPHDPIHADCREIINKVADPDCQTCEENGGVCYTLDSVSKTMGGCLCPAVKSSSSPAPQHACDTKHVVMDCEKDDPTICFKPAKHPVHLYFAEQLQLGKAALFMRGHPQTANCRFIYDKEEDGFCIEFSRAEKYCDAQLYENKKAVVYSAWAVFQPNAQFRTTDDFCLHAFCRYDKYAKVATSEVSVAERKIVASEGVNVRPVLEMKAVDRTGIDAEVIGVKLGEQLKLVITMTDNKAVYTSLRAEVCVVSDKLSLDLPEAQAETFIMDSCPRASTFLTKGTNFFPVPGNPMAIQTGYFAVPLFAGADYIFFHCAVRVCIDSVNCEPEDCSDNGRRKRSVSKTFLPKSTHQLVTFSISKRSTSMYDVNRALESTDLERQTVAVKITKDPEAVQQPQQQVPQQPQQPAQSQQTQQHLPLQPHQYYPDRRSEHQHRVPPQYSQGYGDDFYYRPEYRGEKEERSQVSEAGANNLIVVISILASSFVTMLIAGVIFLIIFVVPKRNQVTEKIKEMS